MILKKIAQLTKKQFRNELHKVSFIEDGYKVNYSFISGDSMSFCTIKEAFDVWRDARNDFKEA
jgi:hypothetical protein